MKYKNQHEVDNAITHYIRLAVDNERKRDACEWESPEYWKYHDRAMKWHGKAESLMPKWKRWRR